MPPAVQSCPQGPPDPCDEIRQKIDDLINRDKRTPQNNNGGTHGLKFRFPEQINGRNGPGTPSWINHENTIKEQQRGLERQLKRLKDNDCGDPPPGANSWATRPVPQPSEWRDPALNPDPGTAQTAAKVVGGAAVGGGALYLLYRGVRLLPSLLPPLWETLPFNLAIP